MDTATISPLLLGWALAGFAIIAWFVWRRRRLGPMTTGVIVGYAALLGGSAGAVAYVVSGSLAIAAPAGLIVALVSYRLLARP